MLAICSDLDETPGRETYAEIMRFLNTTDTTAMGPGVGLEVGNTIYFDMPPNQFAYWNTDDTGREMVRTLIHSGHIDCLHSYGDLATERAHTLRALEELDRHDCRLRTWIDHSKAPSNFGPDLMCGSGDVAAAPVYHADVTCDYGVEYVWRGRTSNVVGQDIRPRLASIFDGGQPLATAKSVIKQAAKQVLGALGNDKYALYTANRLLSQAALRDGRAVFEFLRGNPHPRGPGAGATANGLAAVLTQRMLGRLVAGGGVCLLYTHLGKVDDPARPFNNATCAALRVLASEVRAQRILVATTTRILDYVRTRDTLRWRVNQTQSRLTIELEARGGPDGAAQPLTAAQCAGLTFTVPAGEDATLQLASGAALACERATTGGCCRLGVPFGRLSYPL